ncbi:putative pfkB family carbohydrate kinase [Handroanthus impetiginosus]|uniref:Putative pfkB family carbohydrate kinase n=1 Tax=Handroanthus impetiginosus TaxID=429701 RepID=A0A2G9I1A6_9LAMI|nr:putative pfkB family carbohydrate kinase [Handroanthus impetiginosus]
MSFSLISLPLSSPFPNSILLRKFPPIISIPELSSPSSSYYASSTTATLYSSLFIRTTIHSRRPTCSLLTHSNSTFSSMSSGTDASYTDDGSSDSSCCSSATGELGISDSDDDETPQERENDENESSASFPERWHILGLGQAMVDFSGMVDNEFLGRLGLEKGTRKVVNHEERGRVLRAMDGCSYKAAAGGSLSNTLVALARLGGQSIGGPLLNVAMAGSVGSDPLGEFYRSKLRRANVNFLSAPVKDGTTGTVIVLTTPDAQRTMLAYQGTSARVNYDSCLASLMSKTSILIVEGYLFEFPDTIKTIAMACEEARRCGALVAITASDISCIERHYDDFWDIMANYADVIFANSDEARTFCHFSSKESPVSATRYLSHFVPFVSVTDGHKGSYIGVKGEAVYIPPTRCVPLDTCGAGDAYASGILYGLLRGVSDLRGMGTLASKVASVVVAQQGTRLRVQDAAKLEETFAFHNEWSAIRSDVGSDQISSL